MNKLSLYTLQNCHICNELKGRLKSLNIDYEEHIIDDGSKVNSALGDGLERVYKTESYPIVIIKYIDRKIIRGYKIFISKTDLEKQESIIIFQDIEDLINKLKQIYAV